MNSRNLGLSLLLILFWAIAAHAAGQDILGQNRVVIARCPGGGQPVRAQITPDRSIHLLYDLQGLVWYAVSRDQGKTFDQPICAVDRDSRKPGLEFSGSDLAINDKGQVLVAMSTNAWKLDLPKDQWSFQYATLAPGASAFSKVQNLNQKSSESFTLAADDRGNVAAIWLSGKLYSNFSRDGGNSFSPNAEISPLVDPCPCCMTSAVFGANGDLAILYREEANNDRDMHVLINHRDGRLVRKRISVAPWKIDGCPMSCFQISRDGNGYIAAWPTKGQVCFARLDADGNRLPPGEITPTGRAVMHEGILALAAPDGHALIGWNHDGQLNWQLFNTDGSPAGPPESASTAGKPAAGVVLTDGRFVLFK